MVMKRTPIAVSLAYSICHTFVGCEGMCRALLHRPAITAGAYKILSACMKDLHDEGGFRETVDALAILDDLFARFSGTGAA